MISTDFQLEILNMLEPKIKSVLNQTDLQNRKELEQELSLMVIHIMCTKNFKKPPSFFELVELEKENNNQ